MRKVLTFIVNGFKFNFFLLKILLNRNFRNPIKKDCSGETVAVLANGPSLKEELAKLETDDEFTGVEFVVLNFFAFEEVFFRIKPKHYCLADPMFFQENHRKEMVKALYKVFDRIDWSINIYIPTKMYNNFKSYSGLTNTNLNIISINFTQYCGFDSLRNYFYKKGLTIPRAQTVANMAIYVALNNGYSNVNLYGVDHTFFDSLCVNDRNELCNRDVHFYDKDDSIVELKPILRNDNDQVWKIGDYLDNVAIMFQSHDLLEKYSNYLGSKILNCTKNSMIDSYKRKL